MRFGDKREWSKGGCNTMAEGIDVGAMGASDDVESGYLDLPVSAAAPDGMDTGLGVNGGIDVGLDTGIVSNDPLDALRAAAVKGERDVKALKEKRDVYQRGTREYDTVADQVRSAESDLKVTASALAARERELAPLIAAQKQIAAAGNDISKLEAASNAMYTFFKSTVKVDAFDDAAYTVDEMTTALEQIKRVEAERARVLAAERAKQATALAALKKEVLDASRKQSAAEREVERLRQQMRETNERLQEVEKSEGNDVAQAVALYEKIVRPPPPSPPASKPPSQPTPKPVVPKEEKPARRRVFSRGGGTRDSVVDSVWEEMGLERVA
jgi:hypothetical protein